MPNLSSALRDQDLGFLQVVAGFWGLDLPLKDVSKARKNLVEEMLDKSLVEEVVAALPDEARAAMAELMHADGRLPLARFSQKYGEIRQMGRVKRERDLPFLRHPSTLEVLYYRGLVALAFMDSQDGMQEFIYIPDDVFPLVPLTAPLQDIPLGRPAADDSVVELRIASDHILDDLTTLLAGLRTEQEVDRYIPGLRLPFVHSLAEAAGLFDETGDLDVETVRVFLEKPRGEALAALTRTWIASPLLNDLHLVPSLLAEGGWTNDAVNTRRRLIEFLGTIPRDSWWNINGFIAAIKEQYPEFQRLEGDFESWFLKDRQTGDYLRGVAHWDDVEGALIRWMIIGPFHWLGMVDLAGSTKLSAKLTPPINWPVAFRLSRWSERLFKGIPLDSLKKEDRKVHVRSDGRINVPRLAPRAVRYLLARFCAWDDPVKDEYRYRPTPSSLVAASDHGLNVGQLIHLLARNTDGIPPNVTMALKNWQKQGVAARIQTYPVLRLPSAEALTALRSSRASRFLGDTLGPAAVELKPGSENRVLAVLAELGYLGEIIEKD